MNDWESLRIIDLCESVDYGLTASATDNPAGPRFLRITDIRQSYLDWSNVPFVEVSEEDERKYKLNHSDIVVARTGAFTGHAAYIQHPVRAVFASYLVRLSIHHDHDPRFVYYFLQSPYYTEHLEGVIGGSAQPNASAKALASAVIRVPPLKQQREISGALGSLDDKINQNRQTARTLEELAQRLFKSWFVDFDPVRAKTAGHQPAHMPPETAGLFPDKLVDSPLGAIPEGWDRQELNQVASVAIGRTPPRKEGWWFTADPSDNAWASIRDMGAEGAYIKNTSEFITDEALEKHRMKLAKPGSILYSFKMTIGRVKIVDHLMATNEAIAQIDGSSGPLSNNFLYLSLMNGPDMSMESTSSIAVATNSKGVKRIPILCPNGLVLSTFNAIIESLFERIRAIQRENDTLIELRDRLLPKLISGEIRVPEAQESAEEGMR